MEGQYKGKVTETGKGKRGNERGQQGKGWVRKQVERERRRQIDGMDEMKHLFR